MVSVVLSLDRQDSSVNAMSQDVLLELGDLIERLAMDPPKAVVVQSIKPAGFIAGADLKEFQEFDRRGTVNDAIRRGQTTYQKLSELPCPTVAAIHGHCLGGGTELALACRYRVASNDPSTRIGLPETQLGIFPGWGGSARLPRLVGAPAAMDMMLTGRNLSASAARNIGLVDKVVAPAVLLDTAVATRPVGHHPAAQAATDRLGHQHLARAQAARPADGQTGGTQGEEGALPGPVRADQHLGAYRRQRHPGPPGCRAPRRGQAASTPTARNLIRIFFLTERLKALGGKDHGIRHVHVVGAGVMGGDIAAWSAYKGFEVTLQDREQRFIDPAMERGAGPVRQESTRRQQAPRRRRPPQGRPRR
jgi:3-hydroxyacyl-CoA dehydrogenase/enoyl-CoA hydratase/3-hydroxybutyryl-CoA epimerase